MFWRVCATDDLLGVRIKLLTRTAVMQTPTSRLFKNISNFDPGCFYIVILIEGFDIVILIEGKELVVGSKVVPFYQLDHRSFNVQFIDDRDVLEI